MLVRDRISHLRGSLAIMVVLTCFAACKGPATQGSAGSTNGSDQAYQPGDASTEVSNEPHRGEDASAGLGPQTSAEPSHSSKPDTACPQYPWGIKGRSPGFSAVDDYPKQFQEFLETLKRAVATDDREGVASLIDFRVVGLSRAEFLRRYDEIVTPCLKQTIRCITLGDVAENYLGAWLAHDALLVEIDVTVDRFLITAFTGRGPCYPKKSP